MEDLFEKFRKDEDEEDDMPFRKKKKFKKNMGMEKPEPEDMDDDPDIEDLVERMAGASASAGRAKKNRGKKPPFPIRKKKDEEK